MARVLVVIFLVLGLVVGVVVVSRGIKNRISKASNILPSIPQTCPNTSCSYNFECISGNCIQCGSQDIFPPINQSTIREYAIKRGLLVGVLYQSGKMENDGKLSILTNEYNALIGSTFRVWPEENSFDFSLLDQAIGIARQNNMRVMGVPLIFQDRTAPPWLGFYDWQNDKLDPNCGGWLTRSDRFTRLSSVMERLIQESMRHGGNDVYVWEVVNEPLRNVGDTCWGKVFGEEYVYKAFRYAQEVNGNALLMLNDGFYPGGVDKDRVDRLFGIIARVKSRGLKLDVVGSEMHLNLDKLRPTYVDEFKYLLEKANQSGLQVMVTEMDVYQGNTQGLTPAQINAKFEKQKEVYKKIVAACLEYTNCTGFYTWGMTDKYTWLKTRPESPFPDAKPLLFDENYQKKPAYYGVMEAFREDNTRSCVAEATPTPIVTPAQTVKPTPIQTSTPTPKAATPTPKLNISTPTTKAVNATPTNTNIPIASKSPTSIMPSKDISKSNDNSNMKKYVNYQYTKDTFLQYFDDVYNYLIEGVIVPIFERLGKIKLLITEAF